MPRSRWTGWTPATQSDGWLCRVSERSTTTAPAARLPPALRPPWRRDSPWAMHSCWMAQDGFTGTLQLRIKHDEGLPPSMLQAEIRTAVSLCASAGVPLFINDHVQVARDEHAPGVHLGQEDLLQLDDEQRDALREPNGFALGISSHSLWELARARSMAPRYIACGPVWPTTTKDMPWLPQGLDRLRWWCRMAGAPVVAIGGILRPDQAAAAVASGAGGVCVLRGLGPDPAASVPLFLQAMASASRPDAGASVRIGELVPR
ncbi:MAG: hypothetical protein WDW38_003308 [Sanguina aurantia]